MSSIYQRFCTEIKDENGGLKKLTLNYPDNFNLDVYKRQVYEHKISDGGSILCCTGGKCRTICESRVACKEGTDTLHC